jgi:ribosomal protein S18 acetylase RimI-like enzyme
MATETVNLPAGYRMVAGSTLDRARLVQWLQRTYREWFPEQESFGHMAQVVEMYLAAETPLWWVMQGGEEGDVAASRTYVGGLWMGTATDLASGHPQAHIFWLYVSPEHRRQGLARALLAQAEQTARDRGLPAVSLQVYDFNAGAIALYRGNGYHVQSLELRKPLSP